MVGNRQPYPTVAWGGSHSFRPVFLASQYAYLEGELAFHFVRKDFRNDAVKVGQYFHGKLGFDSAFVNQIIECICQRQADAGQSEIMLALHLPNSVGCQYTCCPGTARSKREHSCFHPFAVASNSPLTKK